MWRHTTLVKRWKHYLCISRGCVVWLQDSLKSLPLIFLGHFQYCARKFQGIFSFVSSIWLIAQPFSVRQMQGPIPSFFYEGRSSFLLWSTKACGEWQRQLFYAKNFRRYHDKYWNDLGTSCILRSHVVQEGRSSSLYGENATGRLIERNPDAWHKHCVQVVRSYFCRPLGDRNAPFELLYEVKPRIVGE